MWVPKPWMTSRAPVTAAACQPAVSTSSCTTTAGCQSASSGMRSRVRAMPGRPKSLVPASAIRCISSIGGSSSGVAD